MNEFLEVLKDYLTPETVTVITTVLLFLVSLLKLVSMVKTLNKQKAMTMDNLKEVLLNSLKSQNQEEINKAMVEILNPVLNAVNEINPYLQTFAKILALSQENTPESRVAILELIQRLGNNTNGMIETIKETINTQEKEKEEKKKVNDEKLNKIIDDGTSI